MPDADLDRDLRSIQEARGLGRAARVAQREFEKSDQERVDAVVEAMAAAGRRESERLARMAHEETGYGSTADKVRKNDFVLHDVVDAMRGMRTVGVIGEDADAGIREIAAPVGVVAGIIPSTNPTSTAMFKCLIAVKARCGIVLSPHPGAKACIKASADVMAEAAVGAGAPRGLIGCMTVVTMQGTRELMEGDATDVILATGGMGLVRAAYSAGKPAFGVGPGNVPAYVHASADVDKAVDDILAGTTFDNGTLCSSEQSIVCDRAIAEQVREAVRARGGHFLDPDECRRLAEVLITDELLVDPRLVGKPAGQIAEAAGIDVPDGTRVLICPQEGAGREYPLSHEKLSPVLAFYEVEDWRQGCERCIELLRFGGMGHTLAVHSRDEEVILEFGLHKPAHRIVVNTVAALGAVGHTTGLFPSMTLGCGSWGNNITSDNIGPQHLIDVKRLARETRPLAGTAAAGAADARVRPSASAPDRPGGDGAEALAERVSDFLAERGIIRGGRPPGGTGDHVEDCGCEVCSEPTAPVEGADPPLPPRGDGGDRRAEPTSGASGSGRRVDGGPRARPVDFVAEEDVRRAIDRGHRITVGPSTIITPLADELGRQHDVFEHLPARD